MAEFDISERQAGDVTILDMEGAITGGEGALALRAAVNRLLEEGKKEILLNLTNVGYIDSTGIGELVASYVMISRGGGQLKLLNLTQKLQDLLTITKLLTVFDVYESETLALAALQGAEIAGVDIGELSKGEITIDQPVREVDEISKHDKKTEDGRHVNVCLIRGDKEKTVVPITMNLREGNSYYLRLDIGNLSSDTAVRNPQIFPTQHLPRTETGHWLEVVVVSDDFQVSNSASPRHRYNLFLPKKGASWVCSCSPGGGHVCVKKSRQPYLFVWLLTPSLFPNETVRNARIRIGIYYQKNLVQSQLLTATVGKKEQEGAGYYSDIDYTLTSNLMDLGYLPEERTINIFTNANADGTHKLVINGREGDAAHFNISEGQMSNAMGAVRRALYDIHIDESEGKDPDDLINRYDKDNRKSREAFIADLKRLAYLGWVLWTELMSTRPDLLSSFQQLLKEPSSIQVSRVGGSTFVFPWALIYDIPVEFDLGYKKYTNCRLLDEWGQAAALIPENSFKCPYENTHKMNVICPFGLWGFKHQIEQPPSMPKGRGLPGKITIGNEPPEMVMGVGLTLNKKLTEKHKTQMKVRLKKFQVAAKESLNEVKAALKPPKLEVLYFYCHGRRKLLAGSEKPIPLLELGEDEFIAATDVLAWSYDWDRETHWRHTSPLVFINGCNTVELTPDLLVNFVDNFVGQYASGVIGTEVTLHEYVASEAASEFFDHFQVKTVGQSLQLMRRHLLLKGNLMGLAYTPYCSNSLGF
jgi:anti-anti-sigma factor